MPETITKTALRDSIPEAGTHQTEGPGNKIDRPSVNRDTCQNSNPFAIRQIVPD